MLLLLMFRSNNGHCMEMNSGWKFSQNQQVFVRTASIAAAPCMRRNDMNVQM